MATIKVFIEPPAKKDKKAKVRYRLSDGRGIQLYYKSEIEVLPENWDSKNQTIKAKIVFKPEDRTAFNKAVAERKNVILTVYDAEPNKEIITSKLLTQKIDEYLHPEKYNLSPITEPNFFERFNEFIDKKKLSEVRRANYRVVFRILQRFQMFTAKKTGKPFELSLHMLNPSIISNFVSFLVDEHNIYSTMPELYEAIPETRIPQPRGQNTINGILAKLRTFCLWAVNEGITTNNPFLKYKIEEDIYGTPYYITIEERNLLYNTDLSDRPQLAIQRDIFVFQCLIGCRVSDLYRMTRQNIINEAIEYIPRKTKEGNPITVRVPLNKTANEILSRYLGEQDAPLFPYIAEQKYNEAIKKAFEIAGLTRSVTVLNPTTREEEKQPLNKIASSHLARRCFIGNLYKRVKDQNLIASLSGHKEGSRAFARYREIDDDMKKELVNLLE
jgi:integrase